MSIEDFGESKVTVKKDELLTAIKKNRETHRDDFLKAQEGYRAEVIRVLDEQLRVGREGRPFALGVITSLIAPQDHTRDYDRVIRMLEMSIATQVSITEQQFQQFVLDDWSWKAQFVATSTRYSRG